MNIDEARCNLCVALLLTVSGGFLDAFTFIGHGRVFANSMTGNVVLLGINAATGDWHAASKHLSPLVGFGCAMLAAHLLRMASSRRSWVAAMTSLLFEIAFLAWAALTKMPEFWLIPGISFVATLQTIFFAQSGKHTYSSVMTTSNLRGALQRFFESTIPRPNVEGLRDAGVLGAISVSFALGAVIGGLVTPRLHDAALCFPATFLFVALLDICRRTRSF